MHYRRRQYDKGNAGHKDSFKLFINFSNQNQNSFIMCHNVCIFVDHLIYLIANEIAFQFVLF